MTSKWTLTLLLVLVGCQLSCKGSQSIEPAAPASTARVRPAETQPVKVADSILWQRLVDDPGQAGVSYKADEILVVYSETPQAINAGGSNPLPDGSTLASQMPNEILRKNSEYEAITQSIADRFGLDIRQQVYLDDLNIASFKVAESEDAGTVLAGIRSEFSGQVDWAIHNPLRKAAYIPNDPDFNTGSFGTQWGHWKIGCPGAWDHTGGDPSVWIAVVDTGVRISHEELSGQVLNPASQFPGSNLDVVNGDNTVEDLDGHGTFISGIAVAAGGNSRTIVGVAPGCRVMPVKISNDGWASTADIVAGCLLAHNLGAKVVNLSFGGVEQVPVEENMVNQIWSGGGMFVGVAGNDGVFAVDYPGAYTNSMCVGSTDYWDEASVFSNWGFEIDIAAPGQELKSCGIASNSSYVFDGMGTSYSAPMVAAGAALLWSYKPTMTNIEVRNTLLSEAGAAWNFAALVPRLSVSQAVLSLIVPEIPTVAGVLPSAASVYGSVVNANVMNVSVSGPQNVAEVTYTLDVLPLGQFGPDDPTVTVTSGGSFPRTLPVPASLPNQHAKLVVEYVSNSGHSGEPVEVPLVIFNQPGDINQDGLVNQQDVDDLLAYIGTSEGSPGWSLFADGSQDGSVNELDLSIIGYNWGAGAVAPEITLVSPLEGTASEVITFFVNVTGTEPFEYSWDFAGATVPATSSDESPQVQLATEGTHEFGVTVTNIAGSDYFPFQFEMAPIPVTVIESVNRIEGYLGEVVVFNLNWSVYEPSEFSWDFDSAGIPGTSSESTPSIELTSEGVFPCSVYAGNGGIGDTFHFDLTVNPTPPPVADLSANPQLGQPPLEVQFDASGSYSPAHTIVKYEWSWDGDEIWESTTDQPLESNTFDELGTYTVRLQVTDEIDRTAQTTRVISVKERNVYDNWETVVLGEWGRGYSTWQLQADYTNVAGRPAICWSMQGQTGDQKGVYVALASQPDPQDLGDWDIATVTEFEETGDSICIKDVGGVATFLYGYAAKIYYCTFDGVAVTQTVALESETGNIRVGTLAVVSGKPAILFQGSGVSQYPGWHYAWANSTNPNSPSDWQVEFALTQLDLPYGIAIQMIDIDGKPMLLGETFTDSWQQVVHFASTPTPEEGDWSYYLMGNENNSDPFNLLINHGGNPAVLINEGVDLIKYNFANTPTPGSPSDWNSYEPISGKVGPLKTGGFIDGKPVFYFRDQSTPTLVLAQVQAPTSEDDWVIYEIENVSLDIGIVDHSGLPGVFGRSDGNVVYAYPIP